MEIMYPIVVIIWFIIGVAIFFINFNKKEKYTNGKKVANTKYIKETDYYKKKVKRYRIISNTIKILSLICILISSILIARPITVQTKSEEKYNRDILIGMDISTSESKVNLELVRKFKSIINDIEGDRIGIIIFNTAPIVFCPLTEDYDYVRECLDEIEKKLKNEVDKNWNYVDSSYDEYLQLFVGTTTNYETRGSSLVGDGLARNNIFISWC